MTYDIYYLANFGGAIGNFVKRHEAELRFSFDIVEKAVQTMVLILCLSYFIATVLWFGCAARNSNIELTLEVVPTLLAHLAWLVATYQV